MATTMLQQAMYNEQQPMNYEQQALKNNTH